MNNSPGRLTGSDRSINASSVEKIALLMPMPSDKETTMAETKPRFFLNPRAA